MLCFLLISLIPLLMIFSVYLNNPNSSFLNSISVVTRNLPAIISANNPILSKSMDTYTKTAPLLALFIFFRTCKTLKLKNSKSQWEAFGILIAFTAFYTIMIYLFLFTDTELTTSGKLLNLLSTNDLFLCFFYVSLYCGIYIFSYLYFWFIIGTYNLFKERR